METAQLYKEAIELLQQLISTPSYSKSEDGTAAVIERFLSNKGVRTHRLLNNVWAVNKNYDPEKLSIVLNSHHDTVKPNPQYSRDPYAAIIDEGKLYGLGSNDAGASLVCLIATFIHFYPKQHLQYNLILAATAEEEISGANGIEALLTSKKFKQIIDDAIKLSFPYGMAAIVGEPTKMQLAIAEKGLLVVDCFAQGKAGHAAREEGDNAIYKALKDIEWFRSYKFKKVSQYLGKVKMNVTVIDTENKAHNMIPSGCHFVVDIRITDAYSHEEVLAIIKQNVSSLVTPRSMRLRSTAIDVHHPLVQAGIELGKTCYGSPTSSDKALLPFPALKCGPGDSARSHTADEFIYIDEIKDGIETYIAMLNKIIIT